MDARVPGAVAEAGRAGSDVATEFAGVQLPRAAVVIGCHNQAAYIEAAIRSVAAQSYEHFECVVLDDASADGSVDRIQEVIQSLGDARFRAIPRRENGGQMITMLEGLDATSGPFVAFLDGDDLWHPAFLERHILAHMSTRGIAAVSCSNLAVIDATGTQLSGGKPNFIGTDPRQPQGQAEVTEEVLDTEARLFVAPGTSSRWIWSATSGIVFRRTVLEVLRPARPERLRICADRYLVVGAHMLGGTVRIERSLGCYRLHDGNGFSRNKLLGSRIALGRPSQDIVAASNDEFVRCLCDMAEVLRATLSPRYVAKLLIKHLGEEDAFALAASNAGARLILSNMRAPRPDTSLRKIKRRLKGWLRLKSDKAKSSR
ncbi:glycosyltransferase family 2 protein [Dongia deserti]|uniref:glycosyltransferase family 2 protein n=1 Tax=Dongia deserti TaxID=2268030 RepID=UPI0013C3EBA8|nr:glycosyltransferase family A protein [Dongia deserti]